MSSPAVTIYRFHASSGVRVALRDSTVKLVILVVAIGLTADPGQVVRQLALGLSSAEGPAWVLPVVALWLLGDSWLAARRLRPGATGTLSHLPAAAIDRRRAFLLGVLSAQLPVLIVCALAWIGMAAGGVAVLPGRLASLAVMAAGAAYAALPVRRWWVRGLGVTALVVAGLSDGALLVVAVTCLAVAESTAGALKVKRSKTLSARFGSGARLLPQRIAVRAVGSRLFLLYLSAVPFLVATWLFLVNNELDDGQIAIGVRLGCGLAATIVQLQLAASLKLSRPPWGWARSLPWSSRKRVLHDAAFLAVATIPLLAVGAWLEAASTAPLAALVGYVALRLSSALRRQHDTASSLGATAVMETVLWTFAVAAGAATAWVLLALWPWAAWVAERQERELKPGRWLERQVAASGEPTS